jgi:hypothetical protein
LSTNSHLTIVNVKPVHFCCRSCGEYLSQQEALRIKGKWHDHIWYMCIPCVKVFYTMLGEFIDKTENLENI